MLSLTVAQPANPVAGDLRALGSQTFSFPPTNPPVGLYESDGSGRVEGDTIPDTFACIRQPAVLSL